MGNNDLKNVIMIPNDIPETMTEKQVLWKKQRKKEKNKKYYHNNKEKLQKINQDQYRGLSEGEKIKKKEQRKYGFPNVPEKGNQKLKKYTKEYNKNQYQNISEKDTKKEGMHERKWEKLQKKYAWRRQMKNKRVRERIHEYK